MRPIDVRALAPAELATVVGLCLVARGESMVGPQVCSPDPDAIGRQLGVLAAAEGGMVLVAWQDDVALGLLLGRLVGPNPFTDDVSLEVEAVYVSPDHRRRGVGHALITGAVERAAQAGATDVYAAPIPGSRGMQRFFVQLGFAPAAAHRVTSVSALQRRLAQDAPSSSRGSSRGPVRRPVHRSIEDLIARRRHSREATGEIAVLNLAAGAAQDASSMSAQVSRAVQIRREASSSTTTS